MSAPLTNMEWQVNRVMHMAGRCVECGACAKACPVGIPLHLLTQNMMETIWHEFEKQPGNLGNKEMHLPLLEWKIKKTSYINGNND